MSDLHEKLARLSPEKRALLERRLRSGAAAGPDRPGREPLAVVGIGCRFPGGANTPDTFWRIIAEGIDAITEVPADRWDVDALYDPDPLAAGKTSTRWGGFVDDVDRFDAALFGIAPREAAQMDPQQRLLLETAWAALEHAGQSPARLRGSRTGVFVGVHSHSIDYCLMQYEDPAGLDAFSGTGTAHNFLSGRLSYLLDLRGPSLAVDTACSSSLVAVHLACQSLWRGESSLALAAGVNLVLTPAFTVAASRMHMMSPDGRCKAFDAAANGFVRGEGCGVVVIKPLARARADGDRVLALVRGTAINQDGHTNGITAPNGLSQQDVIRAALTDAAADAAEIGYIEAHGTGTPLGDPIEVEAIAAVVGEPRPSGMPVTLGSVKSNIGHLEGAAGIAGFIKAVLCLERRQKPPVVHFRAINPHLSLAGTALEIPTALVPWTGDVRRMAGVSSFGWSGTNAHVVLEEAPASAGRTAVPDDRLRLLPFSARTPEAFTAQAAAWQQWCGAHAGEPFADVCDTAARRRAHHELRGTVAAATVDACGPLLVAASRGEPHPLVTTGRVGDRGGIVFVFPGQGSQWIGMGRRLLDSEPVFRDAIEACGRALGAHVGWSLLEMMRADPPPADIGDIDVVQPMLFAVEVALAALWQSWGIRPDAVVGHSMGEVAAAHVAGALTIEDAARVICLRSRLLRRISGRGAMAMIELSLEDTARAIAGREVVLSIAVSNSPRSTVISGDVEAVEAVMAELQQRDVFCRAIKVDVASHSPQVDELRDDLLAVLASVRPQRAMVPIYSTVTATRSDGAGFDASYWADNLRQPVLLSAAVERLSADGHTTFLEMSPHPILLPAIETGLAVVGREGLVLPSLRRDEDERTVLLGSAAALYVRGYDPDWPAINGAGAFVDVPGYACQRERFWLERPSTARRAGAAWAAAESGEGHPILGVGMNLADRPGARLWQVEVDPVRLPYLLEHRLDGMSLLPGSAIIEMLLAAAPRAGEEGPVELTGVELVSPLVLDAATRPILQVSAAPAGTAGSELHVYRIEGAAPQLLVRARVASVSSRVEHAQVPPSAEAGAPVSASAFYEQLEARGIQIGPALRTVSNLHVSPAQVEAGIELSDRVQRRLATYWCDPAALDGLLQLVVPAAGRDRGLYLPASVQAVRWYRRPAGSLRAIVKRADSSEASLQLDLWLTDLAGDPVLELQGVLLKALDPTGSRVPAHVDDWLYQVAWHAQPVDGDTTVRGQARREGWLVFADEQGVAEALADQFERRGQVAHLVRPGPEWRGADRRFTIRPDADDDLTHLLKEVGGRDEIPLRGIVCMWSLDAAASMPDATLLSEQLRLPLRLVQALAGLPSVTSRIWLVTRGAQPVGGTVSAPSQAALWGFGRALAEEHHELYGGTIDLDPAATPADAAAALMASLPGGIGAEPHVAWRDGVRHVPRLERLMRGHSKAAPWRSDGTYLVTGAFGGVGRAVARWLIEQGVRRLVLTGRAALPPRREWAQTDPVSPAGQRIAHVRALEAAGATIHLAQLDLTDEAAVRAWFEAFDADGWPPVRGVVHCAAEIEPALLVRADIDNFRTAFGAKTAGAFVLDRVLADHPLDLFVSCSSMAAVLPQAGQASYAAANATLDAMAFWQVGKRCRHVAIGWGIWRNVGQAAGRVREGIEAFESAGLQSFDVNQGLEALGRILSTDASHVVVVPADWSKYGATRGAAMPALVQDLAVSPVGADGAAEGPSLRRLIESAPAADRQDLLEHHLQELLARVLRLPLDRVDPVTPLGSLGLESLMALELRNRIEASLGMKVSATLVWNHPTVRALALHLGTRLGLAAPAGEPAPAEPVLAAAPAAIDDVAQLSDEEALRALMGGDER